MATKRLVQLVIAAAVLSFSAALIYVGYYRAEFGTFHILSPPDRLQYHERRYYLGKVVQGENLSPELLDEIQKSKPNGELVGPLLNRLEVYKSERKMQLERSMQTNPTILLLRQKDGEFLVYSLSGGP